MQFARMMRELLCEPRLLGESARCELLGDGVEKVPFNKLLNRFSFLIHYPINPEVKVGTVELKQFFQEILEFAARRYEYGHCNSLLPALFRKRPNVSCELWCVFILVDRNSSLPTLAVPLRVSRKQRILGILLAQRAQCENTSLCFRRKTNYDLAALVRRVPCGTPSCVDLPSAVCFLLAYRQGVSSSALRGCLPSRQIK
jgi:hypothetical protein